MATRKKTGGRTKGTPNKTTQITRNLINDIVAGLTDKVKKDIKDLPPGERVRVWIKLCEFCVPKPQTIALDLFFNQKKTIEDKLSELSDDED